MLRRAAQSAASRAGRQQTGDVSQSGLARASLALGEPQAFIARGDPAQGARHASQLAVKLRMRSVQNIAKITSAMKMVAASKMRVAQQATENSRGIAEPLVSLLGDRPDVDVGKNVVVPITSDKGLCGGINSTVCKQARAVYHVVADEEGREADLVVIGEKGRAQLIRDQREHIAAVIQDVGKVRITFSQACGVAEELLKTEFDAAHLIFNRFKSAIAYKPTLATVLSPDSLEKEMALAGGLDTYEFEGPDRAEFLQDLSEFQLAVVLFNGLLENNCSEQASRMAAMEASTKNAKEMLGKLTLSYNRSRQAAITTELTEIISGAAALEK
jgi:F-type H+-transporting ATPase subunit gamma